MPVFRSTDEELLPLPFSGSVPRSDHNVSPKFDFDLSRFTLLEEPSPEYLDWSPLVEWTWQVQAVGTRKVSAIDKIFSIFKLVQFKFNFTNVEAFALFKYQQPMNGMDLRTSRIVFVVGNESTFAVWFGAFLQANCLREIAGIDDNPPFAFDVTGQLWFGV